MFKANRCPTCGRTKRTHSEMRFEAQINYNEFRDNLAKLAPGAQLPTIHEEFARGRLTFGQIQVLRRKAKAEGLIAGRQGSGAWRTDVKVTL